MRRRRGIRLRRTVKMMENKTLKHEEGLLEHGCLKDWRCMYTGSDLIFHVVVKRPNTTIVVE